MLNSTALILIGGKQDDVEFSNKTHIFDIKNQKWSNGPELNFERQVHSCARISSNSQGSENSIIVVGGWNKSQCMSSVEILDDGSSEWRQGPELPYPICCSASVEHPLGGVVLIGGYVNTTTALDTIYHLTDAGKDAKWELMPQKLQIARGYFTAFLVPDEIADYCDN